MSEAPAILKGAEEHPFAFLRKRADVLACCGKPENLLVRSPAPDVLVADCKVCGRRHRKMKVDPASALASVFRSMA